MNEPLIKAAVGDMRVRPDGSKWTPNVVGVANATACGVLINADLEPANDDTR